MGKLMGPSVYLNTLPLQTETYFLDTLLKGLNLLWKCHFTFFSKRWLDYVNHIPIAFICGLICVDLKKNVTTDNI